MPCGCWRAVSLPKPLPNATLAGDGFQRPLRSRFQPRLKRGVDMICMATACAQRTCKTQLLAQALSKSSDVLICTPGKS
jgi:hypothetical protein